MTDITTCWFCGERAASPSSVFKKALYRDKKVIASLKTVKTSYTKMDVDVPCCPRCKRAQTIAPASKWLAVIGVILVVALFDPLDEPFIPLLSGVATGFIIVKSGTFLANRYADGNGWDKDPRTSPWVKSKVDGGWSPDTY